jgi:hypothetical protein
MKGRRFMRCQLFRRSEESDDLGFRKDVGQSSRALRRELRGVWYKRAWIFASAKQAKMINDP